MNKEQNTGNKDLTTTFGNTMLCAVCKSADKVEFITITELQLQTAICAESAKMS